jgi:tRNA nucleotidyltransferase (CCA-adding enzyme)
VPGEERERLAAFRALIDQERDRPHRLADLAVDGNDLIEAGFTEGPQLGRVLQTLLAEVVDVPERNSREQLLTRARELA